MINQITAEFIKSNRADCNRLQKLIRHNDDVAESVRIIRSMIENIPKSKVSDILNVIENHCTAEIKINTQRRDNQ